MSDALAHLLALVAPLAPGDRVAPGWTLVGGSTELGLRLTLAGADNTLVHVEVAPNDAPGPHAVATEHLHLSYRSPARNPVDSRLGLRLCEAVAERVRANEDAVLASLSADAADGRVRQVQVARVLEPASDRGTRFDTLSPYVGCLVGCRFCYAQSRLDPIRRLLGRRAAPWGSYVDARINAPERLAAELRGRPPRPIKFCPIVADPYQAVEQRFRLTRGCLDVLARAAPIPPVLLLTRMAAAVEDLDRFAEIEGMIVGVSLPTVDDEVRRHFEPRAASVPERLDLLARLRAVGVTTMAVVQPLLPGPAAPLADALTTHADSVSIDVLSGEEGATALFDDPRYAHARSDSWQHDRALALRDTLAERGVAVWRGELPPALMAAEPRDA